MTGVSPAVAMPSMSFGPRPASFIALSAASACSPICDRFGMRPSSVVSAAPTMAIDFGFIVLNPPYLSYQTLFNILIAFIYTYKKFKHY